MSPNGGIGIRGRLKICFLQRIMSSSLISGTKHTTKYMTGVWRSW